MYYLQIQLQRYNNLERTKRNRTKHCAPVEEQSADVLEEFAKTYKFDLNPDLTREQRYAVLSVMYQYKSVFARGLQDVKIF